MKPLLTHISCDIQAQAAFFMKKEEELSMSGKALEKLSRSVLDKGASFRFQAKGFSMSPFIKDGDVVTVTPLCGAAPGLGDVVVFVPPRRGKLVVHRVVGKRADAYLVKGDNLPESDGMVPEANILGCVKMVERNGKQISLGLGPERVLIALLTRRGPLSPLFLPFRKVVRYVRRRAEK